VRSQHFDAGPPPAFEGALAPNRALADCRVFGVEEIEGPEELEFDGEGRLYAGTRSGEIVRARFAADGTPSIEVFAVPGGEPNGLTFDREGRLLVSDGYFVPPSRIDAAGRVERVPWLLGADAAVASDGRVFFSDPFGERGERTGVLMLDVLLWIVRAAPTGRLLVYDPATDRVDVLLDELIWPDGVSLSASEDFVAVGEVSAYRITRYWLAGPRAGTSDRLAENLPGFVDGLASDGRGTFYAAIPVLRSAVLDAFHRHPRWKDQASRLLFLGPVRERIVASPPGGRTGYGLVLALDENGHLERSFHDPATPLGPGLTTAEPFGDHLYVGALGGRGIGRCPLAADAASR
jgi:sugar lactone lactonase YvrE